MDDERLAAGQLRLEPIQAVQQGQRSCQLIRQEAELQLDLAAEKMHFIQWI